MNIKIIIHIMPWEVDHALLIADRLKQSMFHLRYEDNIHIDSALNLSSKVINWEASKLPKDFFIEKYNTFYTMLETCAVHKKFIYEGNEMYGHLDLQKAAKGERIDHYISICPDIDFSPTLLFYMIEAATISDSKYFVVTPQIHRCWDSTWDVLVNEQFNCSHEDSIKVDIHTIKNVAQGLGEKTVVGLDTFKFAGWFDLYNKAFYEQLCPYLDEWHGYGPWDFYAMNICNLAKIAGVDVKQYLLKNEIVYFYDNGCLRDRERGYNGDGMLKSTYRKFLSEQINKTQQTNTIYSNMNRHMNEWVTRAKQEKIIQ